MKQILRQFALTAFFFGLLYSAALALTFVVSPNPVRSGSMDVWTAPDTLYLTSPKYLFLARDVLNTSERKLILVGASNTGMGFKQPDVQALVPCAAVSNIAIGSANISEVQQIIDLVHDVQNDAARRSTTFVIGIWFGMFVETTQLWPNDDRQHGDTDIDIERYRYGFYRRTAAGPVAILPPTWLRVETTVIRPYLMLEKFARDVTSGLRHALFVRPPALTDADREALVLDGKERGQALEYWRQTLGNNGHIAQSQVASLSHLIDSLLAAGEKVIVADLPIPAWHRDASPYAPGYAQAVTALFGHFAGRPGFAAFSMPDLDKAQDYSDEVHAKPHLARIWAQRLAGVAGPLICPKQAPAPSMNSPLTNPQIPTTR